MTEDKYVTNAESTSVYSGMEIQEDVLKLRIENEQLKEQIEKMKCCEICKHNRGGCSYHHNWTKECLENKHKYFELKEIDK